MPRTSCVRSALRRPGPYPARPQQLRRWGVLRTATAVGVAALTTFAVIGTAASANAATDAIVSASQLGTTYAAAGAQTWVIDTGSGGSATLATDVFDGRSAIKLLQPSTNSSVNVLKSYGLGVRPTDVASLLAGSSYSYSGSNVNFQLAIFYTPLDAAHYGPSGTTLACAQAIDGGVARTGMCFTTIKYEAKASPSGSYESVSLSDKQAPLSTQTAGWLSTRNVGAYAANGRTATLNNLLAQMSSYEIYGVGAAVGPGTVGGVSWLANLTFGGNSYSFGAPVAQASPSAAPAADTAALDQVIATNQLNPATDTTHVTVSGANADLTAIDATQTVNAQYAGWSDPTDGFVDVYSYSTAAFVGTFPIVNGNVILTAMDLRHLASGAHSLVLQGQTSKSLRVIQLTVSAQPVVAVTPVAGTTDDPSLAATGVAHALPEAITGALLVTFGAALLLARSRKRRVQ